MRRAQAPWQPPAHASSHPCPQVHSTDYIEALLVAEIFGDRSRTDELLKALQTAVAVRYKSEARYDEEAHLNDLVLQLEAHLDEIEAEINFGPTFTIGVTGYGVCDIQTTAKNDPRWAAAHHPALISSVSDRVHYLVTTFLNVKLYSFLYNKGTFAMGLNHELENLEVHLAAAKGDAYVLGYSMGNSYWYADLYRTIDRLEQLEMVLEESLREGRVDEQRIEPIHVLEVKFSIAALRLLTVAIEEAEPDDAESDEQEKEVEKADSPFVSVHDLEIDDEEF